MTRKDKINRFNFLKEKKKRKVTRSFYEFFKFFWDEIVPDSFEEAKYHKYLCDELQIVGQRIINREPKIYDLIVNVPPGSSKSTIISQMFPIWLWVNDASIRIISSSYSSELSMEQSERSRDLVRSDLFKKMFPEIQLKQDTTGKKNYKTNAGGQRYSTSTGGTVTGVHGHVILIDDPVTPQDAESELKRATANDFITRTLSSRKVDKKLTPMIMIMQRLHQDDPTGNALKKWKGVKHIKLPAEQKSGVIPIEAEALYIDGLLDPNRMGTSVLAENKSVLGSYGYAGQFDQNPAPDEGGMFKKNWFKKLTRVEFERMNAEHIKNYPPEWNFASDTAYTKDTSNDPSGIMAYCVINNNLFIRRYEDRYVEFPDLVKFIDEYCRKYGYGNSSRIYVEPKACFEASTLIQTTKGHKEISKIQKGDFVLSTNTTTSKQEYKKVLETFSHNEGQHSINLITFTLSNNLTIKCTENHEFFIDGYWRSAREIAERKMGVYCLHRQEVFDIKQREIIVFSSENSENNEAVNNVSGLRKDSNINQRKKHNSEVAQDSSSTFHSKPPQLSSGEPQGLSKGQQQCRELRMVHSSNEHESRSGQREVGQLHKGNEAKKPNKRLKDVERKTDRAGRDGDSGKIQASSLYAKNACKRIWSKLDNYFKRSTQRLEAREIKLSEIVKIEFTKEEIKVYDLCVEDNHNYCVTTDNIIVHNSGKSAVQYLLKYSNLNIIEDKAPTIDKVSRARGTTAIAESGRVYLLTDYDGLGDTEWIENFLLQMAVFPNGTHDETVDCFGIGVRRMELGSGQVLAF